MATRKKRVALEGMLRYIDMAAEVQSGIVLGRTKGSIREAGSPEAYFERVTESLKILNQAAGERNMPIVIEVINHYGVDALLTARETARKGLRYLKNVEDALF